MDVVWEIILRLARVGDGRRGPRRKQAPSIPVDDPSVARRTKRWPLVRIAGGGPARQVDTTIAAKNSRTMGLTRTRLRRCHWLRRLADDALEHALGSTERLELFLEAVDVAPLEQGASLVDDTLGFVDRIPPEVAARHD
jgi:hypothetical protein